MLTQDPRRIARPAKLLATVLALAALYCGAASAARAASACTIGLPAGTALMPADINGVRGPEWNDAALITSGDACLDQLLDSDGFSKIVRVYSKRYTRNGQNFVAFFFEVQDTSTGGPCTNGTLCNGERVVIQFDSDKSRGMTLGARSPIGSPVNDYQIVVTHKWEHAGGGDVNVVTDATTQVSVRESGNFCNPPGWEDVTGMVGGNMPTVAVRKDLAPGYKVEIEIPLALIGNPASDVGLAFAVINDFGTNCMNGICDGSGASFPNSLTLSNATNPVTLCAEGDWAVPDQWGTGSFGTPPGDVTISRLPDFWDSNQMRVLQCSGAGSTYTWYKDNPCKAVVEARLQNNTAGTQTRNLLFLWAQFGSGDPANYNVIGLKENVSVPSGLNSGPFQSDLWANMPTGSPEHPCVRVYILPPNFLAGFTRAQILAITTKAQVLQMMAVYGLGNQHWAQKNISASTMATVCPDVSCRVAGLRQGPARPREGARAAANAPSSPPFGGNIFTGEGGDSAPAPRPLDGAVLLPASFAVQSSSPQGGGQTGGRSFVPTEEAPPPSAAGLRPEPEVAQTGRNIAMDPGELRTLGRGNVVVQVHTYGYTRQTGRNPHYNFIENLGGVIKLVPAAMLRKQGTVPFQLRVVSPGPTYTIFNKVDVAEPVGSSSTQVGLETRLQRFAPGEERDVYGFVRLPGGGGGGGGNPPPTGGGFKRWGLSLHGGVSFPHGDFDTVFNPGPNFAVDLEYRLTQTFSLEGIYGFHRFNGETFGTVKVGDLNLHQFSFNGKVYGGGSPVRPFFNFGGGVYHFGAVGTTNGGLNVGGGIQFDVTPTFAVEGVYNFHNIFTSGQNTRFSALQGGVRFRF